MTRVTQMNLRHPRNPRLAGFLEVILQSKLQDPRIVRSRNLSEEVAIEVNLRVLHVEAVGYIECFHAEFHALHFTHLETPGSGHVELPLAGPLHAAHTHISNGSQPGE